MPEHPPHPETIAFSLGHGEAKVLITDTEIFTLIRQALAQLEQKPVVIDIADRDGTGRRPARRDGL